MSEKKLELTIQEDQINVRLDRIVSSFPEVRSRTKADFLITESHVLVNEKNCKSSYLTRLGDKISIHIPSEKTVGLNPSDIPLDIQFEDEDIIVVNKPSGLVVHPAAGHETDTLVNALLFYTKNLSMRFNETRPGIVHRLDKETSGLLVIAKNDLAHESLVKDFQERKIHRVYKAVCFGIPQPPNGRCESHIGRHPTDRKRFASVPNGKWSATNYKTLSSKQGLSLIELKLETGRTHQIRVHMSEKGHPLVADKAYGAEKKLKILSQESTKSDIRNLDRFLLHAEQLGFHHPINKQWLDFKIQWPEKDLNLIKKWGLSEF